MSITPTEDDRRAAQSALTRGVVGNDIEGFVAGAIAEAREAGRARGIERGRRKLYAEIGVALNQAMHGGASEMDACEIVNAMRDKEFP